MIDEITKIFNFQNSTKIRCLHNEVIIIKEILENGPLPSLDLMKKTGRSISGVIVMVGCTLIIWKS